MKEKLPPVVLLDANVLYSIYLRDFLLFLAAFTIYQPKWSDEINDEWTRNLLLKRPDLVPEKVLGVVTNMNTYFRRANVTDYSDLTNNLKLPDPNDRHVLAAAIKAKAAIITTANLRDFPKDYISQFDIEILHPDTFILRLLDDTPDKCLLAFRAYVKSMKNPKQSEEEVLTALTKSGLVESVIVIRGFLSN